MKGIEIGLNNLVPVPDTFKYIIKEGKSRMVGSPVSDDTLIEIAKIIQSHYDTATTIRNADDADKVINKALHLSGYAYLPDVATILDSLADTLGHGTVTVVSDDGVISLYVFVNFDYIKELRDYTMVFSFNTSIGFIGDKDIEIKF